MIWSSINRFLLVITCLFLTVSGFTQTDTTKSVKDSSIILNQDAIYNRPFIGIGKSGTAIGGYLEGNTNYFSEDGVSEGFSMEMRRFNIFLYSPIGRRIKFLSELEFEHGTEEIALETALIDFEFNPAFNLRAGILLPSIGIFNTNHDSPNWEFIERPISSTELIPTTLSEVGFGIHGKFYPNDNLVFSYNLNLTNGLSDNIILNEEGRTHIPSGKSEEMFAEDNNGTPMYNLRTSVAHRKIGELGVSYYGGVYNQFSVEGTTIVDKRSLHMISIDYKGEFGKFTILGEVVGASVQIPNSLKELYGENQLAGFADFIYPIYTHNIFGFKQSRINLALRLESIDYNIGSFTTNLSNNIEDTNKGGALGLSWRPLPGTVLRANYKYNFLQDALGNPEIKVAGYQFGFASYF